MTHTNSLTIGRQFNGVHITVAAFHDRDTNTWTLHSYLQGKLFETRENVRSDPYREAQYMVDLAIEAEEVRS